MLCHLGYHPQGCYRAKNYKPNKFSLGVALPALKSLKCQNCKIYTNYNIVILKLFNPKLFHVCVSGCLRSVRRMHKISAPILLSEGIPCRWSVSYVSYRAVHGIHVAGAGILLAPL